MTKIVMNDDLSPELQEALKKLKDCVLISLVKRAGGKIEIPIAEVDIATEKIIMSTTDTSFIFELEKPQGVFS